MMRGIESQLNNRLAMQSARSKWGKAFYFVLVIHINIVLVWTHPGMSSKGSRFDFQIQCIGDCRNITIFENTHSGDVDLFGQIDRVPTIVDHKCASQCKCKSQRTTNDQCQVSEIAGSTFFFTAYVYEMHRNLEVTVICENLSNIVCVGQCGGSNGTFFE